MTNLPRLTTEFWVRDPRSIYYESLDHYRYQLISHYVGKRDLFVVFDTVLSCRKDWFDLCFALRCSYDDLSAIKKVHAGDLTTCLREGLALWLEGAYDTKQHGPPSWRMLVAAVDNSSGGNNPALALEIAEKHKGGYSLDILLFLECGFFRNECSRCCFVLS